VARQDGGLAGFAALAVGGLAACNAVWGLDDLQYGSHAGATTSVGAAGAGGEGATSSTTTGGGASTAVGGGGHDGGTGGVGEGGLGAGGGGGSGDAFCNEAGLVACYHFDGNTLDSSPNANHAVATGTSFAPGVTGEALSRVADDVVAVPANATFGVSSLTIEAWVNPTILPAYGTRAVIFDHDGHHSLNVTASAVECRGTTPSGSIGPLVGPAIPTMVWSHLACTIDSSGARLYIDGELVSSGAGGTLLDTWSTIDLAIGQNAPSGDGFTGSIDELRVFGLARSADQICEAARLDAC
jgi:hypothetical protein